jgi:hypothetical protein
LARIGQNQRNNRIEELGKRLTRRRESGSGGTLVKVEQRANRRSGQSLKNYQAADVWARKLRFAARQGAASITENGSLKTSNLQTNRGLS